MLSWSGVMCPGLVWGWRGVLARAHALIAARPCERGAGSRGCGALAQQCRVVKRGRRVSTGMGHVRVTGWLVFGERGGAPVDQGIGTSPSILNRSSVES